MSDIFGKNPEDYAFVRAAQEAGTWERYQQERVRHVAGAVPQHNFQGLEAGVPAQYQRAAQDAQAIGYLTNNMLAIMTAIDEVMYTAFRLPNFLHLNTAIPEGARSYGVRVRDRRGQAARISAPGYDAPSATVAEGLVTQDIHWYGLDAEWSLDELRGAMLAGIPLDTESIDAAVTGIMETMEAVGLTGGDYAEKGLLNWATGAGDDHVRLSTQDDNQKFTDLTAVQIRTLISSTISKVISDSKETLGGVITSGLGVYLPGEQYDRLTTMYIGDNAEHTVMDSLLKDNPWTHLTGNPINIHRVVELDGAGESDTDRMIVALKHPRVAEMGVSISPRVLRIMDKGRVICAQVEAKFSSVFMKRPRTVYYVDKI